jgi:hypothetical protein
MPTDATYTPTWRTLFRDLSTEELSGETLHGLAGSFGLDHVGLMDEDLADALERFILVEVPNARWDEKAVWPLPPAPKAESAKALAWNQFRWLFVTAMLALVLSVFALATDDGGPSNTEIRQQARVEVYKQLGIQIVDGNVHVLPDGLMATTAKREACKLTARQSVNLRPDLGLDIERVLAVCDAIK